MRERERELEKEMWQLSWSIPTNERCVGPPISRRAGSVVIFCCEVNSAPPGRITANLHIPSLISVTSLLALRAPLSAYIKVLCNCKEGGS